MDILLIDDSEANINMLGMMFANDHYTIHKALSAKQGFELLKEKHIQLAIVDWMMPEVDGLQFVRWVREQITDDYVYIVMVTARDGKSAMLESLESGVDDYVNRPFSPREIRARVSIGERIIKAENELKRSREAVTAGKHEWEATADAIPQLVCLLDRNCNILRTNSTVEEWGLTWMDDASGQNLYDVLSHVYRDFAEQVRGVWEIVQQRIEERLEFEFMGDDLSLGHHFHVHFRPIEHRKGSLATKESFAAVSIQDITQRRKLELALENEHQKSERLLLNILPQPISERLKEGEETIADEFENATVVFSDLVGFTQFASLVSPNELIKALNNIFSHFDKLTEKHGLEKIKTIGDAYMAVSGVPVATLEHASSAVDMALDMLTAVDEFNAETELNLQIRIGVHSGSVVAGVIGSKKFAYDLWGDTVNTASRMESTGEPGCVHISEDTAALIWDRYALEPRGTIDVKGKGSMKTYFVMGRQS